MCYYKSPNELNLPPDFKNRFYEILTAFLMEIGLDTC